MTITINIPNFQEKIIEHIEVILNSINCMADEKEIISSKSLEILGNFILRVKNNEFTIPKNANLKKIAATIIYTISISTKNMVKISSSQISSLASLK